MPLEDLPTSNTALKKIGAQIELSEEQTQLVNQIMSFIYHSYKIQKTGVFTVFGDAGTGKSVVLSNLFLKIQTAARQNADSILFGTSNYFLVNHPEVLKVYKSIAGSDQTLLKKDYQRPTSFINKLDRLHQNADVVVIDEAHLLLSKPDHYNNFYFDNQLDEIIKRARVVVLVFDETQVLRMKSFWTTERLKALVSPYLHDSYYLTHQFRMAASDALIQWFNDFTKKKTIDPLKRSMVRKYDFRVYDDAEKMHQEIINRNSEVGLSRILATSGYPSTLDGGKHYIREGNFKMPWDQYNYTSTPWAELPQTIDEVGSIYTCQGFDLNYSGIIIGPPFSLVSGSNQIQINLDKYTDMEAFKKRTDLTDPDRIKIVEEKMVLNSLNVLFKRGIMGTYIYAHDPQLRQKLIELYNNIKPN
ncbi:DUF2075 domain-containing protein [Paucilactobacillus suebicus]|uniref:Schlafen group 3-like DNA/RNA helicase domain-containing protein n=1 Tax=Paucilactobacillus suebicus DSM 5007 = KCTC 3549 TaxID=1423807 RepID=A0A0R1W656_9LACO|nr:DUF2075 domain-containing protein [Paucilactobacillus suebicus]KRM11563.1 hypothetical protein FD16_GL000681 [Paucilactobacillus suebicus DSM 5007 = KCTC 3549]